jgi:hypothetical protein
MSIELREPTLVWQVERLAERITQPVEHTLELAVRRYFDVMEQEAIHDETEAFWAMHEQLRGQYVGQYVAIYQGSVIDHDDDVSRLERRTRERFGPLPVLIAPVDPAPPRELRWRGGRLELVA